MARLMRAAAVALLISCAAGGAAAQPGQTPTYSQRYRLLSDDERELLARGPITDGAHIGGGLVGTFFGFGLGHAIQGRFLEKGWIFAAGESVASAMLVKYLVECAHVTGEESCDDHGGWLAGGMILAIGFRLWELIDVWYGPSVHNDRVEEIRWRAGLPAVGFDLAPAPAGAGGTAGITLRF